MSPHSNMKTVIANLKNEKKISEKQYYIDQWVNAKNAVK
jgi:hypothetical protein